jgi:hypothetical protein
MWLCRISACAYPPRGVTPDPLVAVWLSQISPGRKRRVSDRDHWRLDAYPSSAYLPRQASQVRRGSLPRPWGIVPGGRISALSPGRLVQYVHSDGTLIMSTDQRGPSIVAVVLTALSVLGSVVTIFTFVTGITTLQHTVSSVSPLVFSVLEGVQRYAGRSGLVVILYVVKFVALTVLSALPAVGVFLAIRKLLKRGKWHWFEHLAAEITAVFASALTWVITLLILLFTVHINPQVLLYLGSRQP